MKTLPPLIPINPEVMPEDTELHESVDIKEDISEENSDLKEDPLTVVDPVDIKEESNEDMSEENSDPTEDPSTVVDPGASRSKLIEDLKYNGHHNVSIQSVEYLTDEKLRERLEETLRCKHPIHKVIERLDLEDVKALICYAGHYSKVYGRESYRGKREDIIYPKILSKVIFESKPEAPISYLTKIQNVYRNNGQEGHRKVLKQFRAQYLKKKNLSTDVSSFEFVSVEKESEKVNQNSDKDIPTLVVRPAEQTKTYNMYGKSSSGKTCNMCLQSYHPKSYSRHIKFCVKNLAALDPDEQPKTYTWRGKSVSGRTCNKCLQSVHPAMYYGHIRNCDGKENRPLGNKMQLKPSNNIEEPKQNIDIKTEVQEAQEDSEYTENQPSKKKTKTQAQKICDVCQKHFRTYHALLVHRLEVHAIKVNFSCSMCDFTAHLPKNLRIHIEEHSRREDKPVKLTVLWKCKQCDIPFSSQERLERHKEIHTKETKIVKQSDQVTLVLSNPSVNSDSKASEPLDMNNEESDPLDLNNEESKQPNDPSVVVDPEASREWMIIEIKLHCQAPEDLEDLDNLPKEKLQERLEETLKCQHPIHKVIARMSVEKVQALICYSGDSSKVFGEASKQDRVKRRRLRGSRGSLSNYWGDILAKCIFKAKPESPMSYLIQLHNDYEITGPVGNKKKMKIFEASVKEEEFLMKSIVQEKPKNQMLDLSSEKNISDPSEVQMDISDEDLEQQEPLTIKEELREDILKECDERDKETKTFSKRDSIDPSVLVDPEIHKVIATLSREEIKALLCYAGYYSKVFGTRRYQGKEWGTLLAQNILKAKPESPLTYLTQLQSEYQKSLLEGGHEKAMQRFKRIQQRGQVPINVKIAKWCSRNIR